MTGTSTGSELPKMLNAFGDTRKLYKLVKQAGCDKAPSDEKLLDNSGDVVTSLGEHLKHWEEFFTEHLNHESLGASEDAPAAANCPPI